MTTLAQITAALRDRYETELATVPVAWDNQKYTPTAGVLWTRFVVMFNETMRVTLGDTARFRRQGNAVVQIFAPKDKGDDAAMDIADAVVAAFRSKKFSTVTTRSPWPERVGETDEWWQMNVTIPFYSDVTT